MDTQNNRLRAAIDTSITAFDLYAFSAPPAPDLFICEMPTPPAISKPIEPADWTDDACSWEHKDIALKYYESPGKWRQGFYTSIDEELRNEILEYTNKIDAEFEAYKIAKAQHEEVIAKYHASIPIHKQVQWARQYATAMMQMRNECIGNPASATNYIINA